MIFEKIKTYKNYRDTFLWGCASSRPSWPTVMLSVRKACGLTCPRLEAAPRLLPHPTRARAEAGPPQPRPRGSQHQPPGTERTGCSQLPQDARRAPGSPGELQAREGEGVRAPGALLLLGHKVGVPRVWWVHSFWWICNIRVGTRAWNGRSLERSVVWLSQGFLKWELRGESGLVSCLVVFLGTVSYSRQCLFEMDDFGMDGLAIKSLNVRHLML